MRNKNVITLFALLVFLHTKKEYIAHKRAIIKPMNNPHVNEICTFVDVAALENLYVPPKVRQNPRMYAPSSDEYINGNTKARTTPSNAIIDITTGKSLLDDFFIYYYILPKG